MTLERVSVAGPAPADVADAAGTEQTQHALRLDRIDLTIGPGEWVFLTGGNGSGKSTLLRLLAGIYTEGQQGGAVRRGFAGAEVSPIVLQQPMSQLFGETPREEATFALETRAVEGGRIAAMVRDALEWAELWELADEPWHRLSGGQRQLAAIAAAVASDCPLLLLDEATSMLDDSNRRKVMDAVRRLNRSGTAVVWTTQRLEELRFEERVVALHGGRVAFDGAVREFLYGGVAEGGPPPVERCGLRLPYGTAWALELRKRDRLPGLPPVTEGQWMATVRTMGLAPSPLRAGTVETAAEAVPAGEQPALLFRPGTVTLVMGVNGAGKTTLLEKVSGLRPAGGLAVAYGAAPLRTAGWTGKPKLNGEALLRYGYCPQSPEEGLFKRTVREELNYSLRPYRLGEKAREERTEAAMASVGWDRSWLERDPFALSGGERRRAALASVAVSPSDWLLLDEPTAGLDGDGHADLAEFVRSSKTRGAGILLVSHDLDWALALSDRVLLLAEDGRVLRLCEAEQLLAYPEWLAEAGIEAPSWLKLAVGLRAGGVRADRVFNPQEAAAEYATITALASGDGGRELLPTGAADGFSRSGPSRGDCRDGALSVTFANGSPNVRAERSGRAEQRGHRLGGFDPRSVWIAYLALSYGLIGLRGWPELAIGAVVVGVSLGLGGVRLGRWSGVIRGYIAFATLAGIWFAADFRTGIDPGELAVSLEPFGRTLLVMLLGFAMPLAMTPLQLRRSLAQSLSRRGAAPPLWVQSAILAVTLMQRFVSVLIELWGRFAKIFLARGKQASSWPWMAISRLRDASLPFLLALFRFGEEVAVALESRGVGDARAPSRSVTLRWKPADFLLVCAAFATSFSLRLLL